MNIPFIDTDPIDPEKEKNSLTSSIEYDILKSGRNLYTKTFFITNIISESTLYAELVEENNRLIQENINIHKKILSTLKSMKKFKNDDFNNRLSSMEETILNFEKFIKNH